MVAVFDMKDGSDKVTFVYIILSCGSLTPYLLNRICIKHRCKNNNYIYIYHNCLIRSYLSHKANICESHLCWKYVSHVCMSNIIQSLMVTVPC